METGDRRPQMVIATRRLQPLRLPRLDGSVQRPDDMPPKVSEHGHTMVPDGTHSAKEAGPYPPPVPLHIALVIPDPKLLRKLRNAAWLIKPQDWPGSVKLHVLEQRPKTEPDTLIFAFALKNLGLASAKVVGLNYPEEIEIGWTDE